MLIKKFRVKTTLLDPKRININLIYAYYRAPKT